VAKLQQKVTELTEVMELRQTVAQLQRKSLGAKKNSRS